MYDPGRSPVNLWVGVSPCEYVQAVLSALPYRHSRVPNTRMSSAVGIQIRPKHGIPHHRLETNAADIHLIWGLLTIYKPAPPGRKPAVKVRELCRASLAFIAVEICKDGGNARVLHARKPVEMRPELVAHFVFDYLEVFQVLYGLVTLKFDRASLDAGNYIVVGQDG